MTTQYEDHKELEKLYKSNEVDAHTYTEGLLIVCVEGDNQKMPRIAQYVAGELDLKFTDRRFDAMTNETLFYFKGGR